MSTGNQQQLQRYARPTLIATTKDDTNAPFSYKTWSSVYQGVIPGQEFKQYNEYLVNWYKDKSQEVTDYKLQLKLNYLTLLKQLQLFFSKEEAENWYNQVNVEDEKELLLAIPYFARKLRDISLYYLQLRDSIKESRLKYNQTGTESGINQQLQKFLLLNYTQKPTQSITLPASLWANTPDLSAINTTIGIQVEELYDTSSYFDRSPTIPVSAYFNTNSQDLQDFLKNKNLNTSSLDWIYNLGVFELSGSLTNELTAYDSFIQLNNLLATKYIGTNKNLTTSPTTSTQLDSFSLQINEGNNFFYWPTGTYKDLAKNQTRYQDIPLSSTNLATLGTAGSGIENADTIFVKTTRGVKGAWLRLESKIYSDQQMEAVLDPNTETHFRFPFPGYGLSAEDSTWTGYNLATDPRFFYLENTIQQGVLNEYWSNSFELTSVKPIKLNDSTLAENKAWPSKDYNQADTIKVWSSPPNYSSSIFSGEQQKAWLYRFDKTDISIKSAGDSIITWPYESLNIEPDEQVPTYYPTNISDACAPLPVSAINFTYALASNALSSADKIYKLNNVFDSIEDATECCWLSGKLNTFNKTKVLKTKQNSFQAILKAGQYNRFVWEGPDKISVNSIFPTLQHQPDCKFVTTPNATYEQYSLCNCKQVNFTPFGHPGTSFNDYGSFCDYIVEDTSLPGDLDLSTWTDATGTTYSSSSAFIWYNTYNTQGFGDGRWVAGGITRNETCYLEKGKRYIYFRANTRTQNKNNISYPDLIVRYNFNDYTSTYGSNYLWVHAFKDENNTWVNSNKPSPMILYPGDIIRYSRYSTETFTVTGTINISEPVAENRNNTVWSNYDYVTVNPTTPIAVTFPVNSYPGINATTLSAVTQWVLTPPSGAVIRYYNTPGFIFYPTIVGVYSLSVTVLTATTIPGPTNTVVTITNIPKITAIPQVITTTALTSFDLNIPGFVLNTPLYGWDYSTSLANFYPRPRDAGAKPFWAKVYLDKDENTQYKGINEWGSPQRVVDDHNFITQPEISDIILTAGSKITYDRKYSSKLNWNQPVQLIITSDKKEWCDLNFTTNSNSNLAYQLNNIKTEPTVIPTTSASSLLLENFVDNEPVEIYYNALQAFVWNITAIPEIPITFGDTVSASQIAIDADSPWANLPNQNYPTVAVFPNFDNLYTMPQIGGFFTPNNLGATVYTEQDFTLSLTLTSLDKQYFVDSNGYRRGLTKEDQFSPYIDSSNNIWLKEPTISGPIAGTNKKQIFKKYQKFIPYQSGYESNFRNRIGLLNPTSRQTPWTGKKDSEWGDLANYPTSYTGEVDVQTWADSQILKQAGLQVDNWVTDIFGNQYGLFKFIKNASVLERNNSYGQIWVRSNSQFVAPANISLANVLDNYKGTSLLTELTGLGVLKIDMFFDTLMIETSGTLLFEKINYDYTADNIFSLTDDARYLSLTIPVSTSLNKELKNTNLLNFTFAKAGETWFLPEEKLVFISVCGLQNGILTPELYQLDINAIVLKKVFPTQNTEITNITSLTSLNITSIKKPLLTYNAPRKEFLFVQEAINTENQNIIIEFTIKNTSNLFLQDIAVYTPIPTDVVQDPPVVLANLNQTLNIPNPLGRLYSVQTDYLTANTKVVLRYIPDLSLSLITVPSLSSQTVYPLSSFSLSSYNDTIFVQPILTNYEFYDLDPVYVSVYGDEEIIKVESLNLDCQPVANGPATFKPISVPDWVTLSEDGIFTGTPPNIPNTYYGSFKVTNNIGSTFYSLNIKVQ